MIDTNAFIYTYTLALNETFNKRIWFVGLQGSYARNESTDTSDIDMVVILDKVSVDDISKYNQMLDTLPYREKLCGFLCSKNELLNWEPSDLLSLYYDTKPIVGNLNDLLPLINEDAVNQAIKIGVCNIYHGCVHNMLYDKSEDILKSLYKSASFVVKTIYFKQTGEYINRLKELSESVSTEERLIVDTYLQLKNGTTADFNNMSEVLFNWAKNLINEI